MTYGLAWGGGGDNTPADFFSPHINNEETDPVQKQKQKNKTKTKTKTKPNKQKQKQNKNKTKQNKTKKHLSVHPLRSYLMKEKSNRV